MWLTRLTNISEVKTFTEAVARKGLYQINALKNFNQVTCAWVSFAAWGFATLLTRIL